MIRPSLYCALALLLTPLVAPADVLIFKGTAKESYLGEGVGVKFGSRIFLVIDRTAGTVAHIRYAAINGEKRYYTGTVTNLNERVVEGPRAKSFTVLARPPKQCAEDAEPGSSEGVYLSGASVLLKINDETTAVFPKVVTSTGEGLFFSESQQPIFGQISFVATFNQKETAASLDAGEDLDMAVARLIDSLELLGYTD
jgi:hypothetical protein